jgi:hypothetical protein
MMGIALWILCGIAALALSRFIAAGRPPSMTGELIIALVSAFAAGLVATALDFGGWAELDWRAGVFVAFCSLAAIGGARAIGLLTRRTAAR